MAVSERQKIFPKEQNVKRTHQATQHPYRHWVRGRVEEVLQNSTVFKNLSIYSEKHMLWQPNTAGRNGSCSAQQHSSQSQLVTIPVTLPREEPSEAPTPSKLQPFFQGPFLSLLQCSLFTASQNST